MTDPAEEWPVDDEDEAVCDDCGELWTWCICKS